MPYATFDIRNLDYATYFGPLKICSDGPCDLLNHRLANSTPGLVVSILGFAPGVTLCVLATMELCISSMQLMQSPTQEVSCVASGTSIIR